MADTLTIKLWLEPEEYAAVCAQRERERLADLALCDRLCREWAGLELPDLSVISKAA